MNDYDNHNMSRPNRMALFWGCLLFVLGIGFLLNNFRLVPPGLFALWPLLVMGLGVWMVGRAAGRRGGRGLVGGVLLLFAGAFWLLENFGRADDRMFLPVLLIALGSGLLLRNLYQRREV